jgi:G3E family GTPase
VRLDAILTVVDAKHLIQHLDDPRPEGVENEAVEQLAFADRVLLNKIDLATDAELAEVEKRIKAINNFAPIIRTQNAVVDLDKVLNLKAFDLKRVLEFDPEFLGDQEHEHDQSVTSVGFELEGDMNLGQLERWLSRLLREKGTELFRYKGVLSVKGFDSPWIFQGVHMLFGASMDDQEWKNDQERKNRFVFIGRNLNRDELTKGFTACIVTQPLRFAVGTKVRCHVDDNKWELGEVIKQWNDGNPYRIRLHNGEEIWVPVDDDGAIRAACRAETRMD